MLAALGMTDIHAMNKLKVILGAVINGVAAMAFIATGFILWPQAGVMTAGAVVGGYSSAHYAQKLPQTWIRGFVIVIGVLMTIYFFVRALQIEILESTQNKKRRPICNRAALLLETQEFFTGLAKLHPEE